LKRRSKIVSFRLSDEEYDSLKNVSSTRGARSVSEFTRSVACGSTNVPDKIEDSLRTLTIKMDRIDQQLQILAEVLQNKAIESDKDAADFNELKIKEPVE
jgi:hypothetical protein